MNLPPRSAARLRRLIPLLGSNHDGEVVATRNAIGRLLADAGSDWHDLAAACVGPTTPQTGCHDAGGAPIGDLARAVRDLDHGRLTPRERTFVISMCGRGFAWQPTPRQRGWLEALHARLQQRAAA